MRRTSCVLMALCTVAPWTGHAETARPAHPESGEILAEIVVTAQKRQESINSVPMTIKAVSGDQLLAQGIRSVADLAKITPGLRYASTPFSTPIYSIRGIGFNESSLGGKPNVSVYVDEVPLAFPIVTAGVALDLARVEILKGPQGTLFGQNSTGGAINYIAAKPTADFEAGVNAEYGRFSESNVEAFASGPFGENVRARIAIRSEQSDGWQKSYTTGRTLGDKDKLSGRAMLEWTPVEDFKAQLTLSGYRDQSDNLAAQHLAVTPLAPSRIGLIPDIVAYPLAPRNARAADWGPDDDYARDNDFYQGALRLDYTLPNDWVLTSISAYSEYDQTSKVDADGLTVQNLQYISNGEIQSFSQELRLAGEIGGRAHWIVGANYADDDVEQRDDGFNGYNTNSYALGTPAFFSYYNASNQAFQTTAAFANVDFDVTPSITLHAAARYTDANLDFEGCSGDPGNGEFAAAWNRVFRTAVQPGGCVTLTPTFTTGLVNKTLDESNTSWRTGLDWKPRQGALLYVNVSKGYKSGSFPILSASTSTQLNPVTQESVLAYEAGFKLQTLANTLQLNGAVFFYDYTDKQIRGRVVVPVFGPLESLVNVPDSKVRGAELQVNWIAFEGFTADLGLTYIDSRVNDFANYDPYGVPRTFDDEAFPLTPKWQGSANLQYEWAVGERLNAFVGANVNYQSSTYGAFGEIPLLKIDAYTLLDLRAGVKTRDERWGVSAWARNVTDKYYWTFADHFSDTTVRFAGMPRTYGIGVTYRYQ